ncbi:MAG: FtsX-like permease family protein [Pseudomonadota bacterium]
MALIRLAAASLKNRAMTALLSVASIALATSLFLGVETLRSSTKAGFEATISGTDLIVGARTTPLNLLLASVFRIGEVQAPLKVASAERIANRPDVEWTVPLSLGDNHRGFRVLGTTPAYFERYQYGRGTALSVAEGGLLEDRFDAVLGARVATALAYQLGDTLEVTHGLGEAGISDHDDFTFSVSGILAPTGTAVDQTIHVSLEAITAIHDDNPSRDEADHHGNETDHEEKAHHHDEDGDEPHQSEDHEHDRDTDHAEGDDHHLENDHGHDDAHDEDHGEEHEHHEDGHSGEEDADHNHLAPTEISALLVGLSNRTTILRTKRAIDTDPGEAMVAVIPGQALSELWQVTGIAERALVAVSIFVVAFGLLSVMSSILTGLAERRREMAILRAVGARPLHIGGLLVLEAGLVGLIGAVIGVLLTQFGVSLAAPLLAAQTGIAIEIAPPGPFEGLTVLIITAASAIIGLVPAWLAYRRSLSDGLGLRI